MTISIRVTSPIVRVTLVHILAILKDDVTLLSCACVVIRPLLHEVAQAVAVAAHIP